MGDLGGKQDRQQLDICLTASNFVCFEETTTATRHFICQLEKIYRKHKLNTIWQKKTTQISEN